MKKQERVGQGHSLIFIDVCKCLVSCGGFKYICHVHGKVQQLAEDNLPGVQKTQLLFDFRLIEATRENWNVRCLSRKLPFPPCQAPAFCNVPTTPSSLPHVQTGGICINPSRRELPRVVTASTTESLV